MTDTTRPRSIHEVDLTPDKPVYPSPADWRDQFIYFLLIDRFNDGDDETPPYDGVHRGGWHENNNGVPFQGGNIAGITKKLDYLKGLGVTTLWISPILKNRPLDGAYHGYMIQDYFAIDPRIGTIDDLKVLVHEAHARGLYVILDIVINHTGDNWYYKDNQSPLFDHSGRQFEFGGFRGDHSEGEYGRDDAVWPVELQNPDCYKRRGGIVNWDDPDESVNGDFMNLKELNLSNPDVLNVITTVYKYWIKEVDIDGYRIDTVKNVEDGIAAAFCNAVREYAESIGKHNFFIYGEIVSGDDMLRRYVGPRVTGAEQVQALDAALDFPLYFILEEVIKGFAPPHILRDRYNRLRYLYPDNDAGEYYVTFLDNHDQMARPFRRFLYCSNQEQALLGIGYLLTTPGIPTIYYGTEQGFDGGGPWGDWNDAFIRENMFGGNWGAFGTTGMHFFNTEHPLYRSIARVAEVRREEPALRYGRFYFREISDNGINFAFPAQGWGMLAYARILDTTECVVVLNLKASEQTNYVTVDQRLTPSGTLMESLLDEGGALLVEEHAGRAALNVTLGPHEMAIYRKATG